jgi:hypothetical protein
MPAKKKTLERTITIPFTAAQLNALIEHLEDDNAPVMPGAVATTCTALKAALTLSKMNTGALLALNKPFTVLQKAVVLLHGNAPELAEQLSAYIAVEEESQC